MVSCETDALTMKREAASRPQRLLPWAALAFIAATCLVGAVVVGRSGESAPESEQLLQMWNRPYTTTMLWNAANDDAGSYNQDSDSDDSQSYTAFDTYGSSGGGGSSLDGNIDSDLKEILPSSELKGDGLRSSNSHEWDTSELADSNWGSHTSDSSWGTHDTHGSWLGTNDHSWDSAQKSQMKQELRKMYRKGVDHIPKSVSVKAAKEASTNFFGKWAKIAGKKMVDNSKKYGLSTGQEKLYKEAEKSEEKEQAKKAKFVSAVKTVAAKATKKAKSSKADTKAKHDAHLKLKLKAADKLASDIDSKKAAAKKALIAKKKAGPPPKDPGAIGSRSAVKKTLANLQNAKDPKSKHAAQKRMAALEEQIKSDFDSVTSFAHKVKTSLPPLNVKA